MDGIGAADAVEGRAVLWTLILGTMGLGLLVLQSAVLQRLFSLSALPLSDALWALSLATLSVIWFEPVKLIWRRRLREMTVT